MQHREPKDIPKTAIAKIAKNLLNPRLGMQVRVREDADAFQGFHGVITEVGLDAPYSVRVRFTDEKVPDGRCKPDELIEVTA